MATAKLLILKVYQISWWDEDADHGVVIVQCSHLWQQPQMSCIFYLRTFENLWPLPLIWPLGFLSTGTTGQPEVRPCVAQRQCVIRCWPCDWTCGKHSLSSSWAHHSGLRASTSADMLDLITATGWLDYTRHWLKYPDNFLLGDQQRSTATFSAHRHPQGRPGLSLWDNLLKVTHIQTLLRLIQSHWARCWYLCFIDVFY